MGRLGLIAEVGTGEFAREDTWIASGTGKPSGSLARTCGPAHATRCQYRKSLDVAWVQSRIFVFILFAPAIVAGCATSPPADAPNDHTAGSTTAPFLNVRDRLVEYAGPGRDESPPEGLTEVAIGWFGPTDANHPTAGAMWCAAKMAIDEANAAGGCDGLPFRLVGAWSEDPWGTGIRDVALLAYGRAVWAFVGGPDGPSAHLVEQVAAKARVAFVSPVATDKTANLVNVPWIFSCCCGDHLIAPPLADAVVSCIGEKGCVLISCTDHDSRLTTTELLTALDKRNSHPVRHLEFAPQAEDFAAHLRAVRKAKAGAVVVIAGGADSARVVLALRASGVDLPVFGGPMMGRRAFATNAGEAAEGVRFPLLWHPLGAGENRETFAQHFSESFGREPDYTAAYTYDATNLLMAAIGRAGLNRVRIRDAIRELSPFNGVTGTITWDPTGHNNRHVGLGAIRNGRIEPICPEER